MLIPEELRVELQIIYNAPVKSGVDLGIQPAPKPTLKCRGISQRRPKYRPNRIGRGRKGMLPVL